MTITKNCCETGKNGKLLSSCTAALFNKSRKKKS